MTIRSGLRRSAGALAAILFYAGGAGAGDQAERHVLGFSPDGSTFAFEQFGVQDGSGFPYSDIFVIDTLKGRPIEGSPFVAFLRDERAEVKWARRDAMTQAGNTLRERVISHPGRLLASNPPEEVSADPHKVVVNVNPDPIAPPELWTFTIREKTFRNPICTAFVNDEQQGFTLTMQKDGEQPRILHDDTSIPEDRICAVRYAISDVVLHDPKGGKRVFAVLISVFKHGFEGPDRRFLAVTAQVP